MMMNALNPVKMGVLLSSINMNGTNINQTKVGVDFQNTRMSRIRKEGEGEIIALKTDLEHGLLMEVVNSEEPIIASSDGFYTHRNHKAQAMLSTLHAEHEGKTVCISSLLLKRKQRLSDELAKTAPGIVVDLPAGQLESYGLELQMKHLRNVTDRRFYLCAAQGSLDHYVVKTISYRLYHIDHIILIISYRPFHIDHII